MDGIDVDLVGGDGGGTIRLNCGYTLSALFYTCLGGSCTRAWTGSWTAIFKSPGQQIDLAMDRGPLALCRPLRRVHVQHDIDWRQAHALSIPLPRFTRDLTLLPRKTPRKSVVSRMETRRPTSWSTIPWMSRHLVYSLTLALSHSHIESWRTDRSHVPFSSCQRSPS